MVCARGPALLRCQRRNHRESSSRRKSLGSRGNRRTLDALRFGSEDQPVLAEKGRRFADRLGPSLSRGREGATWRRASSPRAARRRSRGSKPASSPTPTSKRMPRAANDANPVGVIAFDLGKVGNDPFIAAAHARLRRRVFDRPSWAVSCVRTGAAPVWMRRSCSRPPHANFPRCKSAASPSTTS